MLFIDFSFSAFELFVPAVSCVCLDFFDVSFLIFVKGVTPFKTQLLPLIKK